MNYMSEIAKMLGVEIGEVFEVRCDRAPNQYTKARFTDSYFEVVGTNVTVPSPWNIYCLHGLLEGNLYIKHLPWKPNKDELYFFVDECGIAYSDYWIGDACEVIFYKIGNCYRTREEAEADSAKWIEFYKSEKILEV